MHHDTPLISTIVAGLVLAFIFGMIANRFKMPPLVGYLFAGVLVGPHTPGFVADQAIGAELAELGVILLMFGVGLHFSLKDLMSVRALAIPGAVAQMAFATLLGAGLGLLLGWELSGALLFGLALSVASTVVLLKALQDRRLIETEKGRVAVGWLIVEDLAMVLALVLIPAIASLNGGDATIHDPFVSFVERIIGGSVGIWGVLGLTIVKVAAFVGFMLIVGRRFIPWALHGTAHTGSRELFRLAVLAIALGVALGSAVLFGVSLALGAFFAGMILSESELSHRAAQETLPLRDAFAVLFFVSVGMLFDPSIIITDPLPVLATVFIIVIGKSAAAFGIVLLFKRPVGTALTISASLAQIGEFSFILASLGVSLAILPAEGQDLILAGALISIVLNPVVFFCVDLAKPRFEAKAAARKLARDGVRIEPVDTVVAADGPITSDAPTDPGLDIGAPGVDDDDVIEPTRQRDHTVLVGFGRVGRVVGEGLHAAGAGVVVIEDADHAVAAARAAGLEVVVGNAASTEVLKLANLQAAQCLMIAIPNGFEAGTVCEVGRKLSPPIRIIARAHSDEERAHLKNLGADTIIMGEREIGLGMLAWLRGERIDETLTAAVPPVVEPAAATVIEPKLPPVENLLAKAATAPIMGAAAAASVASAGTDAAFELATADIAAAETAPAPEADIEPAKALVPVQQPEVAEIVEPDAPVEALAAPAEAQVADDPVVIDAVEAGSDDSVIVLPAPDSAAALETVEATPAVGEAPAPIEPIEVVPPAEPVLTTEQQEDAETNEGGPVEPEPELDVIKPEDAPVSEVEPEPEDKPEGIVPPVVPEPKI